LHDLREKCKSQKEVEKDVRSERLRIGRRRKKKRGWGRKETVCLWRHKKGNSSLRKNGDCIAGKRQQMPWKAKNTEKTALSTATTCCDEKKKLCKEKPKIRTKYRTPRKDCQKEEYVRPFQKGGMRELQCECKRGSLRRTERRKKAKKKLWKSRKRKGYLPGRKGKVRSTNRTGEGGSQETAPADGKSFGSGKRGTSANIERWKELGNDTRRKEGKENVT